MYSIWQAVKHLTNLNLGLEHTKSTLNVSQLLVVLDHLLMRKVWRIGHQQQLAANHLGVFQSRSLMSYVRRTLVRSTFTMHQMGITHIAIKLGSGSTIREFLARLSLARILIIEFAHPLVCLFFQLVNSFLTLGTGTNRYLWIMRNGQAQFVLLGLTLHPEFLLGVVSQNPRNLRNVRIPAIVRGNSGRT